MGKDAGLQGGETGFVAEVVTELGWEGLMEPQWGKESVEWRASLEEGVGKHGLC